MDLKKLLYTKRDLLMQEAEVFSSLSKHQGEKGRSNEALLARLLRERLPTRIKIHTGFIECASPDFKQSPQQDLIFYDDLENAPFYKSDEWSVFPIEMVLGTLEVKTTLTKDGLINSIDKSLKIREMAESGKYYLNVESFLSDHASPENFEVYQGQKKTRILPSSSVAVRQAESSLAPRFFIFAYKCNITDSAKFQAAFKEACSRHAGHCHGLYVIENNWFIYKKPDEESFPFFEGEDAWIRFLNSLNWTMLHYNTPPADLKMYKKMAGMVGMPA